MRRVAACLILAALGVWPAHPAAAQTGTACGYTLGSEILAKWRELGAERALGCPTMHEAPGSRSPQGSTGRWVLFQHGLIAWMTAGPRANQAFEVRDPIKNRYVEMGATASWLGFPVSGEYEVSGGRRSDFEGGYIVWDRATNQVRALGPGASAVATAPVFPPLPPPPATSSHVPAPAAAPPPPLATQGRVPAPATAPAPALCNLAGDWHASTDGVGSATWTFKPAGPGRYIALETGLGNAIGDAVVSGSRLTVNWATGEAAGRYEWDLGAGCSGGVGTLVFTAGRSTSHASRISRGAGARGSTFR